MSRPQRSDDVVTDIAERFFTAVDEHLGLTPSELSRRLGYSNPSTIQAIKKRTSLPDFARLAEHKGALRNSKGQMLNLHWVITGDGSPLVRPNPSVARGISLETDNDIIIAIRRLSAKKRAVLMRFLADFQ